MFYDLFCKLCDEKGVSVTKATTDIGLSRTIGTKWKKTGATPNGETLNKISAYFGVSIEYLLELEDKDGLSKQDWKAISEKAKALREQGKLSVWQAYDDAKTRYDFSSFDGELSLDKLKDFEESGSRISPTYLAALSEAVGVDGITYFYPYSRKLFGFVDEPIPSVLGDDSLTFDNLFTIEKKKIPLLGDIACGKPIYADEDRESYVIAGTDINADFCLRARGDSMIGARILDGDIVFIQHMEMVNNGDIAAVIIGDEATLKRVYYYPEKGKLVLNPENPKYEPLVYVGEELNEIHILGKAIAFQSDVI